MDSPGDAKYGMTKPQMFQAYRILLDKGAKEFGIHAFLASNTATDAYYPALAMQLFRLAAELHEETARTSASSIFPEDRHSIQAGRP
jgi:diaminopimelate decarboxylase